MTPAPKPRRISREEAIRVLTWLIGPERFGPGEWSYQVVGVREQKALDRAIRALKREQKAADAKKKETKR